MLKIRQFQFSLFGVNTYLVIDEATNEAAVIDPAMQKPDEERRFAEYLQASGARLTQIINTHLHLDHCFGVDYVKSAYGVPLKAHKSDRALGEMMDEQYAKFGLTPRGKAVEIDVELKGGDIISIGESSLRVIHVPGHTNGGIALYDEEDGVLFSGDTLFRRSIGRTDLPGGFFPTLLNSIKERLYVLPDETLVLPGHNESTTIGEEKRYNPFT